MVTTNLVATKAYDDQKPGTSGLRKKVKVADQPNYIANFIQSIFNALSKEQYESGTLLISGDGRFMNKKAIQTAIQIAAGNRVGRVWIGRNGWMSTPACSCVIRERENGTAFGGIVLTASHNPGGPNGDFGIKYNIETGAPAPEHLTDAIYAATKSVKEYKSADIPEVDLANVGRQTFDVDGREFVVEIISPTDDWLRLMKSIFDFDLLKNLVHRSDFSFLYDGLSGIAGPYAKAIFIDELGAKSESLQNCDPLEDFKGGHPDPNLTYAHDLVAKMCVMHPDRATADTPIFGAAGDGDNDRNMILGRAWFVTPSDSVAIIARHAKDCIPYFKRSGIAGVSRSMPTSMALDRVAEKLGVQCYETPTGWKYFGNLMDAGKVNICGEESFGTGSDHIREKDGLWAVLCWMSILAYRNQDSSKPLISVKDINEEFWKEFGRNYYSRYDYEEVDAEAAKQVMNQLLKADVANPLSSDDASDVARAFIERNPVSKIDNFAYTDPVDHSVSENQGARVFFKDGSRYVIRLSGTGSSGATIRLYLEKYEKHKLDEKTEIALAGLVATALSMSQIQKLTGREQPTVIT